MRSCVRVLRHLHRLGQYRVLDVHRLISALAARVLSTRLLRGGLIRVAHIGDERVSDADLVEGEFVFGFDAVENASLHVLEALIELVLLHNLEFGLNLAAWEAERHLLVRRMAHLLVNYPFHFLCSQDLSVLGRIRCGLVDSLASLAHISLALVHLCRVPRPLFLIEI